MEFDLAGVSVALVMPVHRDLPWQTVRSLVETQSLLQARGIPLSVQFEVGGSIIESARSKSAHAFLKKDANRLFWVDSDICWQAEDFFRLMAFSTVMDVVGATYPKKEDGRPQFSISGFLDRTPNEYGCVKVGGLGLGFTIVRRHVIEALSEKAPRLRFAGVAEPIPHIFRCDSVGDEFRGEDMAFFSDVRALGVDVHLDPTVTLGHVGSKAYTASISTILQPTAA